jgi:hypothetical protein
MEERGAVDVMEAAMDVTPTEGTDDGILGNNPVGTEPETHIIAIFLCTY